MTCACTLQRSSCSEGVVAPTKPVYLKPRRGQRPIGLFLVDNVRRGFGTNVFGGDSAYQKIPLPCPGDQNGQICGEPRADGQRIGELMWFPANEHLSIAQGTGVRKINPREKIPCERADILVFVQIEVEVGCYNIWSSKSGHLRIISCHLPGSSGTVRSARATLPPPRK